jgi:hypothetical protein
LAKEVPKEEFPNVNNPDAYEGRINSLIKSVLLRAFIKIVITGVVAYGVAFKVVPRYWRK